MRRYPHSAKGAIGTLRFYSYVVDLMQKAVNRYCVPRTVRFSDLAARKQQANLNLKPCLKPHACRKQASMQQAARGAEG